MGILSQDLDKTVKRFVSDAIYVITASQLIMLIDIGYYVSIDRLADLFSIWRYLYIRNTNYKKYVYNQAVIEFPLAEDYWGNSDLYYL
jgi:hypothetical protein